MISRRGFLGGISAFSASSLAVPALQARAETIATETTQEQRNERHSGHSALACANSEIRISIAGLKSNLWSIEHRKSGQAYRFSPPSFPVTGGAVEAVLTEVRVDRAPEKLANGVTEYSFEGTPAGNSHLKLP